MSEFINTIDLQGDQETLDALVSNTQTEYSDNSLRVLCNHALRSRTSLTKVNLSNVTSIGQYAFNGCMGLTSIDLNEKNAIAISANAFNGASNLKDVIIRSDTVSTLSNVSAFTGTKINYEKPSGAIFVPQLLRDSYRSATNWSTRGLFNRIIPIEDYPTDDYSSIRDSWEEIFAAEQDGTYSSKYRIGDTKSISYNGATIYVEIVAIDGDDLADGTGKAKITWLTSSIIELYTKEKNASWKWDESALRSYLASNCMSKFPTVLQDNIKEVTKTYNLYNATVSSCSDKLWIPSAWEIRVNSTGYIEKSGVQYSIFTQEKASSVVEDRIRKYNEEATPWWLRSVYDTTSGNINAVFVNYNGGVSYNKIRSERGIVFGFCT